MSGNEIIKNLIKATLNPPLVTAKQACEFR